MAAAIPTVWRLSSLDPDDPRLVGPPAPAIPGPPVPPGTPDPPGTPVPPPPPAGTPAPPKAPAPAAPAATAPAPSGAGRGIGWVPPGAIRPRARANSRTTHRLAAPSRSCAPARVVATDWMAP